MGCGCGFQTSEQILPQRGSSQQLGWEYKTATSLFVKRTAAAMEPTCSPPLSASAEQNRRTCMQLWNIHLSQAGPSCPTLLLTRSWSSRSCFPLSPPRQRSSSSSSWLAAVPPALGPCFTKNSSLWSNSKPCNIQAASCLYMTPWQTVRILWSWVQMV